MKERMRLTNIQKMIFEEWAIEHAAQLRNIVPPDRENTGALVYNLVQAIRGSQKRYSCSEDQIKEILSWHLDAPKEDGS